MFKNENSQSIFSKLIKMAMIMSIIFYAFLIVITLLTGNGSAPFVNVVIFMGIGLVLTLGFFVINLIAKEETKKSA